jgi:hypothetical protein
MMINKKTLLNKPGRVDEETLKLEISKIENILNLLDKTVNIMKIFSFRHENVKNFVDQTFDSLLEYFEDHLMLDLEIKEFSFEYQGETVFTDTQIDKSLPYLFFKDGTIYLYLKRGLSREEFEEFLKVIHTNTILSLEESDIVFSIWEKDFVNINYLATDELLAAKIGVGMKPLKYKVDKDNLFTGSMDLNPEDKRSLSVEGTALGLSETASARRSLIQKINEPFDNKKAISDLSEYEVTILENMIESNREMSSQDELLALYIELLYLDQRPENFSETLTALENLLEDLIKKGDFERVSRAMDSVREISEAMIQEKGKSLSILDEFYKNIRKSDSLALIKKAFYLIDVFQYDYFLSYLTHVGPASLQMIVDLYDENRDEVFLVKISDYLKDIAKQDASSLMSIISENRPEITKYAISALGLSNDPKAVHYLSQLVRSADSFVKKEAIQALGISSDMAAAMVLLSLLSAKNRDIRILAAQNLSFFPDDAVVIKLMRIIREKSFQKRSIIEKRALLEFLGKLHNSEVMKIFQSFIKKPGLFFRSRKIQTGQITAAVLKTINLEEAYSILESGTRLRNKKIRQACQDAMEQSAE